MEKKQILNALYFRYACKEFDKKKKIPKKDFELILEAGRLSPSSFGFEPWKFIILQNGKIREKLREYSWGAQKQLPTASHVVIFFARAPKDLRYNSKYLSGLMKSKGMPSDAIKSRQNRFHSFQKNDFNILNGRALFDWACKQTYIALANMMTAAAMLGIDSCPIEGFSREKVEGILQKERILDKNHFGVSVIAAFGFRKNLPAFPKQRQASGKIIKWIK